MRPIDLLMTRIIEAAVSAGSARSIAVTCANHAAYKYHTGEYVYKVEELVNWAVDNAVRLSEPASRQW